MADDEDQIDEEKTDLEDEEYVEPPITHVTASQWAAIALLFILGFYVYFIWPTFVASEEVHLKEPQLYLKQARDYFDKAHSDHAFPKTTRIRAFQKVVWNYEAAHRAGAIATAEDHYQNEATLIDEGGLTAEVYFKNELALTEAAEDHYRNGLAAYELAGFKYNHSKYALVKPIKAFENCYKIIKSKEKELRKGRTLDDKTEIKPLKGMKLKNKMSDLFDVELDKISFLLGMNYLKAGVIDKAIPHFINLQSKKHQYETAHRNPLFQNDRKRQVEKALGFSPYDLQVSELFSVDFHLGEAYYKNGDFSKATKAINGYLESNRKFSNNKKISKTGIYLDAQARFEALSLLGKIHWLQARETRKQIKQKRAARGQLQIISHLEKKWKAYLSNAKDSLEELFLPEYRVYGGLYDQKIILAEVNYFLGNYGEVKKYAKDYWPKERVKVNRMELWRLMALLKINPYEPVGPFLRAIADENTERELKLGALVVLGNTYNERGKIDVALGKLISGKNESAEAKSKSVYLRAAIQFEESEFDNNPYIEKIHLIDAITKRIMLAREESDEDTAISLYIFLYNKFTVPEAQLLHQIAYLQRQKAREIDVKLNDPIISKTFKPKNKKKLKEEAHDLYKLSGESFLKSLKSPFDKSVFKDIYFQAGESYFEGGYYTIAYEMYGKFINSQWGDKRISEAQFKKGTSALYRNRDSRFEDAKMEFFANILKNQRPVESNYELPENEEIKSDSTGITISKDRQAILDMEFLASANIKLDEVLTSLGNINNSLNNYKQRVDKFKERVKNNDLTSALYLYDRIKNDLQRDSRFSGNKIVLPKDIKKDLELMKLKKILSGKNKASRDIWAYKSHLELANVYYASHNYDLAIQLYENIRNDSRFTPQSDIWRRAAYENAKVNYDKVSQSEMDLKPWHVAIAKLEDVLFLYNLPDYEAKFSAADKVLLETFKKENAKIKFLLIKSYLANNNLDSAELHAKELLDETDKSEYILSKNLQQTSEALYGDVLFQLKKYELALEYYRRAHDRNLEAFERPFYSLNIVDCLVGMGKKPEAINRLKRTHWEFKELYKNDNPILHGENKIDSEEWMRLIEERIKVLES